MRNPTLALLAPLVLSLASAQTPPAAKKATPAKPAATKPAASKPASTKPAAAKPAATPKPAGTAKVDPNDPVVMTVGTQKITKSEFEGLVAALPEQVRAQATGPNKRKFAEQVAEMRALAYEARQRKLDQSPEMKVKIALQVDNVLANELVSSGKVDPAAVQTYYDQHKGEYEQVRASHILIRFKGSPAPARSGQKELTEEEALAKIKELREKVTKGGDFAAIAKAESDDTGSGANGGSLGSFGRGQMVPPFEQAAFTLPAGQISEPVKTQFGWHIIKVDDHSSRKFEEVKPQIESRLKQEAARKTIDEVKKAVPIVIEESYFGK